MLIGNVISDPTVSQELSLFSRSKVSATSASGTVSETQSGISVDFAASLKDALADMNTEAPETDDSSSSSASGTQGSTWNWTTISPGVSTAVGPDGTKWMRIDESQVLTPDDKRITGWVSGSSTMNIAASLVAQDRADGSLMGPITKDYLLGNAAKGIVGIGQRGPGISQTELEDMVKRLSA